MAESKGQTPKKQVPIYVIAGKEKSLINAECEKLLDKLLEPEQRLTGFFNADPAKVSATDILDELRTLPFLTDKRVVLTRNADDFVSENRETLEKYFDSPCPTGIFILTVRNWPPQTKLAKKLSSVGKLLKVTTPARQQLPRRLIQYAHEAHEKTLSETAAELLVELTGDELVRLYGEVDKLSLFAHNEKLITEQHVESLIGHNRIFNAFAVIEAIMTGDIAQAIRRLRIMFTEDKTAEYTIVGAFAYHFRKMFNAKVLLENGISTSEITQRLRIWGERDNFFAQLRKVSFKQISSILQQLAAIDYAIKKGRTKAEIAVEQLVLKLARK